MTMVSSLLDGVANAQSMARVTQQEPAPAKLPAELILQILDNVVPSNPFILLAPSHNVTKTLLAFTAVCRITYRPANKLLRTRCVYLDSSRRLADLLLCLPRLVPSLPPPLPLKNITDLYLSPFGPSLDDLPTAMWVRELLFEVCDSLKRLVVDMPFESLEIMDDHLNVKRTLRAGFLELVHLEEFIAVGDYPLLSVPGGTTDVWLTWPKLRRLTLFNVPLDSHWLWWAIADLEHLEDVILASPENVANANVKDLYYETRPPDDPLLKRRLRVMLLDLAYEFGDLRTQRWRERDPEEKMKVEVYGVPRPFYSGETRKELVTSWVKRGALDGSIWTWHGKSVTGND